MSKALKNYSSRVPVERTIAAIERLLKSNLTDDAVVFHQDDQGRPFAVSFKLANDNTNERVSIRIDVPYEAVLVSMPNPAKPPVSEAARINAANRMRAQALRGAWRLVFEWLECQISMIRALCLNSTRMFMPFVEVKGRTLFDIVLGGKIRISGRTK